MKLFISLFVVTLFGVEVYAGKSNLHCEVRLSDFIKKVDAPVEMIHDGTFEKRNPGKTLLRNKDVNFKYSVEIGFDDKPDFTLIIRELSKEDRPQYVVDGGLNSKGIFEFSVLIKNEVLNGKCQRYF